MTWKLKEKFETQHFSKIPTTCITWYIICWLQSTVALLFNSACFYLNVHFYISGSDRMYSKWLKMAEEVTGFELLVRHRHYCNFTFRSLVMNSSHAWLAYWCNGVLESGNLLLTLRPGNPTTMPETLAPDTTPKFEYWVGMNRITHVQWKVMYLPKIVDWS